VNERRNPTLCAENRFFSSSFHGFSPRDDSVASGFGGRLAKALRAELAPAVHLPLALPYMY
jgi:hypothetical protein